MKKLRFAVIGAGRLGSFHAQKLATRKDVELVAIVDPVEDSRQRLAAECHTEALPDCCELIGKIDAAIVATPTIFHFDVSRQLLAAGVHLLVEKPLCATYAEADELVKIAQKRGVILQVGHVERFNPAFRAVTPQITAPQYIDARRCNGFTFRSMDIGVVLDLMIHDIDLVLSMVRGSLIKVEAVGMSVVGRHEDIANARLEFDCGCVATFSASRISYEAVRRMEIWSADSFATLDFAARAANLVVRSEKLQNRQFDAENLTPEELAYCRQHFADEYLPQQKATFDAVDALALEQEDFLDSIRNIRQPVVSGEAGRDAIAVAERILESIRVHRWRVAEPTTLSRLVAQRPETKAA